MQVQSLANGWKQVHAVFLVNLYVNQLWPIGVFQETERHSAGQQGTPDPH